VQNVSAMLRVLIIALLAAAGSASAATLDESLPSGANYDKAEFRFWYPDSAPPLRATAARRSTRNSGERSRCG
jgi:hypothetical protein